jgi:L-ascorbate metabolism protein UlaG (beta-lactamase superfamily)
MTRIVLLLAIVAIAASVASPTFAAETSLTWYGQSFFTVTSSQNVTVAFDPYHTQNGINYAPPPVHASAVFVSHDHFDHNNIDLVKGMDKTEMLPIKRGTREGRLDLGRDNIRYKSVFSYHDADQGKKRGGNTINIITVDGVRICHMGDIGTTLTADQVKQIGAVDILLIPVGGVYTVDAAGATAIVDQLKPKVVIPMHYKTPKVAFPLNGVEPFIKGKKDVEHGGDTYEFTKRGLPKSTTIHVMSYKG